MGPEGAPSLVHFTTQPGWSPNWFVVDINEPHSYLFESQNWLKCWQSWLTVPARASFTMLIGKILMAVSRLVGWRYKAPVDPFVYHGDCPLCASLGTSGKLREENCHP
jgi:hypothetical protein